MQTRICDTCGKNFDSKRKDACYCSPACRISAHRKRKRNVTDKTKDKIRTLKKELSTARGIIQEQKLEIEALTGEIKRLSNENIDK
ncbi:Uncharacterized protein dnl_63280 [Desulfonema limicola]|uniref:Uncharacterized protein n=1 Tax=Desulfonema limicola TaxID=45656 RepID=A0A975BEX8_9BACT|nr:hypothetical protein [Desulfonema limicola]QTA83904.1 Uncharacterized protein dnl_63280 [Desulfonema limicola]